MIKNTALLVVAMVMLAAQSSAQTCPLPSSLEIDATVMNPLGRVVTFRPVFPGPAQSCWVYQWNFDDGSPLSSVPSPTHAFGLGEYVIRLTIVTPTHTKTAATTIEFQGDVEAPGNVFFSVPTPRPTANTPVIFVGSALSLHPITEWRWDFGDNTTARGEAFKTVTHAYRQPGAYTVSVTAANRVGVSSPGRRTVVVAPPVPQAFSMILPAVAHQPGLNGSFWQTDLHVFAPAPATTPVVLDLEFAGERRTISSNSLSHVVRDVLRSVNSSDNIGMMRISGQSLVTPQIWTRTYNTSSSGTYGQAIPTLPSNGPAQQPSTLIIGGLEANERLRTNIGLTNLSGAAINVRIDAMRPGILLGSTTLAVPAASLVQFNLASRLPGVAGPDPFGIRFTTANSNALYAYASVIDAVTNDPTFIEAVREDGPAESVMMIPGVGHVGAWRSDISLMNSYARLVKLQLAFVDEQGQTRGVSDDIVLVPGETRVLRDIAWSAILQPRGQTDVLGTLVVTVLAGPRPFIFARTYNQQTRGTFGQGIPPVDPSRPNVRPGEKAVIAGVLENADAYTNLGLLAVGGAIIRVTLLAARDSSVVAASELSLDSGESRIIGNILSRLAPGTTEGTLQIEVTEGSAVWAYGSLVDRRTSDPEYIPARPLP